MEKKDTFKCPYCKFTLKPEDFANYDYEQYMNVIKIHILQLGPHMAIYDITTPDPEDINYKLVIYLLKYDLGIQYISHFRFIHKYSGVIFEKNFSDWFECYPERKRYYPEMDELFCGYIMKGVRFSYPYKKDIWINTVNEYEEKQKEYIKKTSQQN
jgi:hypothetical protein